MHIPTLVLFVIVTTVVAVLLRKKSHERFGIYTCQPNEATIYHNNNTFCLTPGDYYDTSNWFPSSKSCTIMSGPNKLQAFYKTNFNTASWSLDQNRVLVRNCWPWSIKVTKA